MEISDYDLDLPDELIAQEPLAERQASRMLALDRETGRWCDDRFENISSYLKAGDVLVFNNTRVFPARLFGRSSTGARIEIFLVRELAGVTWEVLARPGRRLREGSRILFGDELSAVVREKTSDGRVIVDLEFEGNLFEILDRVGTTPLPPYIRREKDAIDRDRDRYQTTYAKVTGAIAAPTAGLHFTPEIVTEIERAGVVTAEITLHVGYGTFEPVRAQSLDEHKVAAERFEVGAVAADAINSAIAEGRRVVAVGTTTTRALESSFAHHGRIAAGDQTADITVTPGYEFKVIKALLTNFHLPQSSLLVLTATFGGHRLVMDAYRHAVKERYRFYSYGDCMFIA